jgi:hypothetical protein
MSLNTNNPKVKKVGKKGKAVENGEAIAASEQIEYTKVGEEVVGVAGAVEGAGACGDSLSSAASEGNGGGNSVTYLHTPELFREKVLELRAWIDAHDGRKPTNKDLVEGEEGRRELKFYQFLTNCKNYWKYGQSWSHEKEKIWTDVFGDMRLLESQRLLNKFAEKVDELHQWIQAKQRHPRVSSKSQEEVQQYDFLSQCFAYRERGCSWSREHDAIWAEKFGSLEIFMNRKNEEFSNNVKHLQKWIKKNGSIPSRNKKDFDFDEHYLGEFLHKCRKERRSGNTAKWTQEKDQIWLDTFHNYEMI